MTTFLLSLSTHIAQKIGSWSVTVLDITSAMPISFRTKFILLWSYFGPVEDHNGQNFCFFDMERNDSKTTRYSIISYIH